MRVVNTSIGVAGVAFERERDPGAFGAPDPVALHREHLLGPLGEAVGGVEQLVGVGGDAEEPLLQVARLDRRPAAPAAAVHHLLVGQHRVVHRAPVHRRLAPVGQPLLEHPDEEPLVPLVVLGVARGQLALPGVADAEPLQLALHVRDVGAGGGLGVDAALDGGVLGRQAERVPAERMQHVVAAHALGARHHVADDVVAHVAHVRVPRRIGEHLEAVELRTRRIDGHLERAVVLPAGLPLRVEFLRVIVGHEARGSVVGAAFRRPGPAEAGPHIRL